VFPLGSPSLFSDIFQRLKPLWNNIKRSFSADPT
jgi:hypothetical protein